jgi:hypothetical protein
VFGCRPLAGLLNDVALLPEPSVTLPTVGTRVPNMSSQVPGLLVLRRNQPVAASPFGLAVPLSWAVMLVMLLAAVVVTVGALGVTKLDREPTPVPAELLASAQ